MDDDEDFTLNLSSVISNVFQSKKSESADDRRKLGVNVCCLEGDENAEEGEKVILLDKENLFTPRKKQQEGRTRLMTPRTGGKQAFTPIARKPFAEAAEAPNSQDSTPTLSVRKSSKKRQSLLAESPDAYEEEVVKEEEEEEAQESEKNEKNEETVVAGSESKPKCSNDSDCVELSPEENDLEDMPIYSSARKGKRFSLLESPPSFGKVVASLDLEGVQEEKEEEEEEEEVAYDNNDHAFEDDPSVVEGTEGSLETLSRAYTSNKGLRMLQQGLEQLRQGGYNPAEVFLDLLKVGAEHAPLPEHLLGSEHLTEDVIVNILSLSIENLESIVSGSESPKQQAEEEEEEEENNLQRDDGFKSIEIENKHSDQVSEEAAMAKDVGMGSEDDALAGKASPFESEDEHELVRQQEESAIETETETTIAALEVSANDELDDKESCPEICDPDPACANENDLENACEEPQEPQHQLEDQKNEEDLGINESIPCLGSETRDNGDDEDESEILIPEAQSKLLNNITTRSRSRRASTFHLDSDSDMDIGESPEQQAYQLPVWAESAANQMAQQDVDDVEIEEEKSPCDSLFVDCQARDHNAKAVRQGDSQIVSPPVVLDLASPRSGRPSTSEEYLSAASQTPSTSGSQNEREVDNIEEVASGEVESKPATAFHESWADLGEDLRQKSRALLDSDLSTKNRDSMSPLIIETRGNEGEEEEEEVIDCHTPDRDGSEVLSDDDMSCSSGGSCVVLSTAKPKRSQLVIESDSEDDDIFECEDEQEEGRSPGKEMLFNSSDAGFEGGKSDRSHLAMKRFQKEKDALTKQLFSEFNERIFQNKLPSDLKVSWNSNLNTTAGITKYSRRSGFDGKVEYAASVELSSKVIDSKSRLRQTLCHELCHAGAWLVNHVARPPHGKVFKYWADKAMEKYPDLNVTTCHTYDIHYKFRWQCSNDWCGRVYGRHSNSINTSKQACGICSGKLNFLGKFNADGTPQKARAPSQFSLFVKEHYKSARKECGGSTADHATIMKSLSEKWNEKKELKKSAAGKPKNNGVQSLIAQFETFET